MSSHEPSQLTEFANELADISGRVILPMFRAGVGVENKGDKSPFDPVTAADRAGEQAIRDAIAENYPDHTVRGEEFPDHIGSSEFTWVLDPIDGTKAFIMGMPTWATLIGLLKDGEPHIGVMNQPFIGERFVGAPGSATVDGPLGHASLATSSVRSLGDALVATTFPGRDRSSPTYVKYLELEDRCKSFRYGGDAYFYCLLAAGLIDVVVDAAMGDYDIAALIPIIEGAGGVVTTWDGGKATGGGDIAASATPELHSAVLETLTG